MTPDVARPRRTLAASALALALAALLPAGCATPGADDPNAPPPVPPEGAVEATRTESNGDVVTEYRVNGVLSMVRIVPRRGPTYYLMDADNDGQIDRTPHGTRDVPVYFKLYGW